MPPDVREWLPEDHFAWFVLGAVESMELAAFYGAYRADGRSRPAFDPAMMVALILYAYARGNRSSRAIERACVEDIAYRVIAAQSKPDHATIARFVERHQGALAELFGAVLGLCAQAGLVGLKRRRSRWQQGLGEREPRGQRRLRTARARDDRATLAKSTPKRTSASVIAAATSCRHRSPRTTGANSGSRKPSAGWMTSAPPTARRFTRNAPSGSARPSGAWMSSSPLRLAPTRPTCASAPAARTTAAGNSDRAPRRSPTRHPTSRPE